MQWTTQGFIDTQVHAAQALSRNSYVMQLNVLAGGETPRAGLAADYICTSRGQKWENDKPPCARRIGVQTILHAARGRFLIVISAPGP